MNIGMHRLGGPIAIALLIACPTMASADDIATAKQHYERGTALFDLQRYLEAAKEYEAAFEAKNDPALLFNIGQAYRFGGDYAKATAAFRSYLRRVPGAENRAEVQLRISELQKLLEEQKRSQQAPPTGTLQPGQKATPEPEMARTPEVPTPPPLATTAAVATPPAERPGRTKLIAGIAVAAFGVAAIAAGGALEGLASSKNDALSRPPKGAVFNPSDEQALKTYETLGPVMLGIGGAALAAGAVLAVIGQRERARPVRAMVIPAAGRNTVGVTFNASF